MPVGQVEVATTSLQTASLDFCGGDFPSENERLARYAAQINGEIDGDEAAVLSDAVQYRSEAAAASAVDELRRAVQRCDAQPHRSIYGENQPISFKPGKESDQVPGMPLKHYLVGTRITTTDNGIGFLYLLIAQDGPFVVINCVLRGSGITENAGLVLSTVVEGTTERLSAAA